MQFCLQSKFLIIAQETVSSLCSQHFQYILEGSDWKENTSNISSIVRNIPENFNISFSRTVFL